MWQNARWGEYRDAFDMYIAADGVIEPVEGPL